MGRKERIITILNHNLQPIHLDLQDNSHKHAGHAGAPPAGETHYSLTISSPLFAGLSKVQCHQKIYALLADEFKTGLHALAIEVK